MMRLPRCARNVIIVLKHVVNNVVKGLLDEMPVYE